MPKSPKIYRPGDPRPPVKTSAPAAKAVKTLGGPDLPFSTWDHKAPSSPAPQKPAGGVNKAALTGGQRKGARTFYDDLPPVKRCHESHPSYEVAPSFFILGGSGAHAPAHATVRVVLERAHYVDSRHAYPWTPGAAFMFAIPNYGVPSSAEDFKALIEWLAGSLEAHEVVHVGCIGGHGRTGMVLAALRAHMCNDTKAIEHVRAHYCKKAVETESQVLFLMKHFGVDYAKPRHTQAELTQPVSTSKTKGKRPSLFDDGFGAPGKRGGVGHNSAGLDGLSDDDLAWLDGFNGIEPDDV